MNILKKENCYLIEKNPYFVPELFFDCGQSFRFNKYENSFIGVAFHNVLEISECNNYYKIESATPIKQEILESFFDLSRDYQKTENELSFDDTMKKAISFGRGIRILKQEYFETLLTFIYSQRSNIPKIAKCVSETARLFGDEIIYKGQKYYSFPTPKQLSGITEKDLEPIKCGYRAPYIIDAVHKVNNGEISLEALKDLPYSKVKEKLLSTKGIGDKVADCICLFSFGFFEAFPTDTWIKKAMDQLYNVETDSIKEAADTMFKNNCGIAQQYLFYYLRYNKHH